ncbi:MAG TPA: DNA (cytosine-5-)-methyltransferase [Candidatus Babeliaceae bacterium]|nr:DNA (cytosine-5-)-methyltransferase [Candidatus Babeliaceae bacterium]
MPIFRLGELFSGPGGIACGAMQAQVNNGFENFSLVHEWANDYDKDTCETYRQNICPKNSKSVICKDVRKLNIDNLSTIDALAFGFPCNDFSVIGEQKGINGIYGPLYSYGIKALKRFEPKWFLAENVSGLRNSNDGVAFKTIITELVNAGYNVVPHLYKFEEYEIPQARHRIIIIGIRKDLNINFKVPIIEGNRIITASQAINEPAISQDAFNNELTRQSETVVERLSYIRPGENAFTANLPDRLKLNIKGAQISQIYKRLDPNKPAYTVTGSGGGGTHIYHWQENRALTNRERARLQTFPDNFLFLGSKESVRKQIGMAVPPKAAHIIIEAILKCFAGIEYPYIEPNLNIDEIVDEIINGELKFAV